MMMKSTMKTTTMMTSLSMCQEKSFESCKHVKLQERILRLVKEIRHETNEHLDSVVVSTIEWRVDSSEIVVELHDRFSADETDAKNPFFEIGTQLLVVRLCLC